MEIQERIAAASVPLVNDVEYVQERGKRSGQVRLDSYDPSWPGLYAREESRIRAALGSSVRIEHVGSTSVPGLAAKPIIDILLVVPSSADEASYAPALESAGYVLRLREPGWQEHRLFKGPDTDINLHVFSPGAEEIDRMISFRDWLRTSETDRLEYERTKRSLAAREWEYVQDYADAKTVVVERLLMHGLCA
ncbi:GrpB family protein [Lentzea tibetensis]|uniref:GrpB family protein n=2 Tax=Lentzea tibetensis TaxID=2591470 RepID=A0A563EQ85_9PSEU|nr:GrpB family protein [Lentzea tibetensis]